MDYLQIKQLAKREKVRAESLLALAPQNDPFYVGAPATVAGAEWFVQIWERFGYTGAHLRRMHYEIVSHANIEKPNGVTYENTEGDWSYLCQAGKWARCLGLVPASSFVDRRNPKPHIVTAYPELGKSPHYSIDDPVFTLPSINTQLMGHISLSIPDAYVGGYGYDGGDQPYHLELWIEKSTMDDVLIPLGQQLNVNIVTGIGYLSITSVVSLLRDRVARTNKPARVFYISDFDPAGDSMPVAVARQIEYWLPEYVPGGDIALNPLALTKEQVKEYRLPRVPVKDADKRKANFENRYGEGAVELDALEALHRGELARIVRAAVAPYRDTKLRSRLAETAEDAETLVNEVWERATEPYNDQLQEIRQEAERIAESYESRLEALQTELEKDMGPLWDRLENIRHAMFNVRDTLDIELPDRPTPNGADVDEGAWLFRSGRDYLTQMSAYRARKNGTVDGDL